MKNNNGFTIIELLVVIAIIGILVLFATPKVTGYIESAKIVNIKNDVRAAEVIMDEYLLTNNQMPHEWQETSLPQLNKTATNKKLYDIRGVSNSIKKGSYKEIDSEMLVKLINTTLKGKFYSNEYGNVYYSIDNISSPPKDLFDRKVKIKENSISRLIVLGYNFPNGIFQAGEVITGDITVKGVRALDFNLQVNMVHAKTESTINIPIEFSLEVDEVKTIEFSYTVLPEDLVGFYNTNMTLRQVGRELHVYSMSRNVYIIGDGWEYFKEEDFKGAKADVMGRIGALSPDKISYKYVYDSTKNIDYSNVTINIDPNDNVTGQAYTRLPITFGTYEALLKVPDSQALLNSFFLFGYVMEDDKPIPYEIDMEVLYRDGRWQLWTTIFNESNESYVNGEYSEPGTIFHDTIDLNFDPSEDYHSYKIDFYDDYVYFSLDNQVVSTWNGSFDYGDMSVYTGTFYTHWLSKEISSVPLKMEVEWIRRGYFKQ